MRKQLTADDLFSHVLMLHAAEKRAIFLVEGDSDFAVLQHLVDAKTTNLIPGYGKKTVKGALEIANKHDLSRLITLLDRDWLDLLEDRLTEGNVFYTDYYDIDATIFFCGSVANRVVANFSDREKVASFLARMACDDMRHWCVRITFPLGILRYVSQRDDLQLSLDDFPIEQALVSDYSGIDLAKMVGIAYSRSSRTPVASADDIRQLLAVEIATLEYEPERYCSGHDIARALSAALRKCDGSEGANALAKSIRAALGPTDWMQTQVYTAVRLLEQKLGRRIWSFE